MSRFHQVAHRVARLHIGWVVVGSGFWLVQLVGWIIMMVVVEFVPSFQKSLLYTIQISHWALVITCGTAATATMGILTSRHKGKVSEQQHREIEGDIAALANTAPGTPQAHALSQHLLDKLTRGTE